MGVARDSPSGEPFAVKATQACLLNNPKLQRNVNYAVGVASSSFVDWVRRYSGLPVVGELNMLAFGRIDNGDYGDLFFFGTAAQARSGAARLVDFWVYGRGKPAGSPTVAAMLNAMGLTGPRKPPTSAAAAQLHQTYGNVVVIWQYPRHHPLVSSLSIRACL